MTLVVAYKFDGQFRIFSDTKITNPQKPLIGIEKNTLKSVILSPNLCVCFGGNVGRAIFAIQELHSKIKSDFNLKDALDYLLEQNIEGNNDTDFILATILLPVKTN